MSRRWRFSGIFIRLPMPAEESAIFVTTITHRSSCRDELEDIIMARICARRCCAQAHAKVSIGHAPAHGFDSFIYIFGKSAPPLYTHALQVMLHFTPLLHLIDTTPPHKQTMTFHRESQRKRINACWAMVCIMRLICFAGDELADIDSLFRLAAPLLIYRPTSTVTDE